MQECRLNNSCCVVLLLSELILTPMAVGLSQSLTQQSGTVSQISSGTRRSALTLSDVYWRRICLRDTSACSALEVDNFMRYINLLTYLLSSLVENTKLTDECCWWSLHLLHWFVSGAFVYLFQCVPRVDDEGYSIRPDNPTQSIFYGLSWLMAP